MKANKTNVIRVADIIIAVVALAVFCPIMVCIYLILLKSGPPIFIQKRLGMGQEVFNIFKFRTMPLGTPDMPSHETFQIEMGKFERLLRRSKLDELPQLLNVWKGEMSIVGPRPCLLSQAELIGARKKLKIFDRKPGITGFAQIKGVDMSNIDDICREDVKTCSRQGLRSYCSLIFFTLMGKGLGIDPSRKVFRDD